VIGGGFTGIELATELRSRLKPLFLNAAPNIILIDRNTVASGFSEAAQTVIHNALKELKITLVNNANITQIKENVIYYNNTSIESQTVIMTAGMSANCLTQQFNFPLDELQRLPVSRDLRIDNTDNCWAAGDVASATTDGTNKARQSCQHASLLGRFAGYNAAASLLGLKPINYEQIKYVTCLDLGPWGALFTEGWDQQVIKTKQEAKEIKRFINQERIYPPKIDQGINVIFNASAPVFTSIKTK
jgi:NADH:ubiquinone reductase (H+-translocating)